MLKKYRLRAAGAGSVRRFRIFRRNRTTSTVQSRTAITLTVEPVDIPPFRDILILTKKNPHGLHGIVKCMNLIAPQEYDLAEISHDTAEEVIMSRNLQRQIPRKTIISLLEKNVFNAISPGDLIKVDMTVRRTIRFNGDVY